MGAEVVSNWCQHGDEVVAAMSQRKDAKFVEDVLSIGDCWEQPVEVILVNSVWEECDNFEEIAGVGAEFLECWRSERDFCGCRQTLIEVRPKRLRAV